MCYDRLMKPTVLDHLIASLLSARSTRIYREILWSRVRSRQKNINNNTFRQNIYRLRKKGIIETNNNEIIVYRDNLSKFLSQKNSLIKTSFPKKDEKLLMSFDIPETKKKTRDWLRNQLKYWDFELIHKSLWIGYGPLPKEFNDRLVQLKIKENVRIFKVIKAT